MQGPALLLFVLMSGVADYARPLDARKLDQAALDAEGYGEKKAFAREDDGLRVTLAPGQPETGWKTPQQLRIGGDFTITADFLLRKLPKPAQEDGVAVGLAIASGDPNQPDATLVRLLEPTGADVYRSVERSANGGMMNPQQMMMQQRMMMMQGMAPGAGPGGKPPKPPRPTFPASGEAFRIEFRREGGNLRFQVYEGKAERPRYLGQTTLGTNDIAAVKLFATNRNGLEAVNVLLRGLTIRADRVTGLGTAVRSVFGEVVYAEPTAIEAGALVIGGPPKAPPAPAPKPGEGPTPASTPAPSPAPTPATTPAPATVPAPAAPAAPAVTVAAPAATDAVIVTRIGAQTLPAGGGEPPPPQTTAPVAPAQPAGTPAPPATPKEKARFPLDQVESVRFERPPPQMTGRFLGQPDLDFTGPHPAAKPADAAAKPEAPAPAKPGEKKAGAAEDVLAPPPGTTAAAKVPKVEPKKNGIRDLQLGLANLRPAPIKQVTVTCQTDKGPTSWRLDTSDSQDWPLVLRRTGTEAWADLFLEPPPADCHQKDFNVVLMFEDGQNANANIKATEHTDPKLAADPRAPTVPPADAWVELNGGDRLYGRVEKAGEETLRLTTAWQEHLDVPLLRVAGVHFGLPGRKESPESFAKRLKSRGAEDLLLAQTKDGEVVAIPGALEAIEGSTLRFAYKGSSRTLPLKQVEGIVMAARAEPKGADEVASTFSLPGAVISGRWKEIDTATWKVETPWGQGLSLPAAEVQGVRFRGGEVAYLSDLSPSRVEETPFFGRKLPWRRDVNLLGEPLRVDGRAYEKGVAVHSRSVLTYDLDRKYGTFEALVGFDDAARGKGRVACKVLADGKELYANPDLRADAPPVTLSLPVAGAERLSLVVDFGQDQDTGDRVIWAGARLVRRPPPAAAASR